VLRWCELASSVVRDAHDRPEYVLVSVVDITRHKRSQAALRDLATRDPLSGLANRRWFELQLAQHLRLCVDDGPRGALIVVDLDRFKEVNDTHGHQAGDRLVVEVAVTLRRHLRDRDVVARLGGDEFAVILSEGDRGAAEAVARKLVLAVRDEVGLPMSDAGASLDLTGASNDLSGGSSGPDGACSRPDQAPTMAPGSDRTGPRVTVSVGVAAFEVLAEISHLGASTAARDAVKAADAAMYSVKHSGRNGYAVAGTGEGPHHARPRPPSAPEFSAGPRGLERAPTRLSVAVPAAGAR
jgi:diguanylate cyclase (GGDEF)-like protein